MVASLAFLITGCSKENAKEHPTIVVGVDGADWAVIEELWSQGRLPALRDIADRGTRAVLRTSWGDSPVIWTTMATGALPVGHGITGFVKRTPHGIVPVTSDLRRVPALWNMLSSLDRRTIVVGWWATWPAEEIDGVVVSDRILEPIAHTFSPASLAPEIERGLSKAAAAGSPFDRVESGGERDRAMASLARNLAAQDFDLMLVYFRTPDITSHYYWRYFEERAQDNGQSEDMRERIYVAYEAVDRAIADIVAAAGRPVNLIVVSDHGFQVTKRDQIQVAFDLDVVLERLGYLVRDEEGVVDAANSALYTFWSGRTQSSKMLRYGGCREAALRRRIERDVVRFTWADGAPALIVANPTKRQARSGADLVIRVETDSVALPLLLDGEPVDGVVGDIRRITGRHPANDGVLLAAGPDIAAGGQLDGIHVRDIAPTVLYSVDAPVAEDFAGRAFVELFSKELGERRALRTIASWGTREARDPSPSAADEKLLEELRSLGYLE